MERATMAPVSGPESAIGTTDAYRDLDRYGLIGDCGSAALVSDQGSIDWMCLPRVDSEPLLARLLDPDGGQFALSPGPPFRSAHRYLAGTAVLATTFETADGRATVYDFFAARPRPAKRRGLWPFRYMVRRVEGEQGVVRLRGVLRMGKAFGPWRLRALGPRRLAAERGGDALLAHADGGWEIATGEAHTVFEVRAGDHRHITLAWAGRDLGVLPPTDGFAEEAFCQTVSYWRTWAGSAPKDPRSDAVQRSALTIKLLTFAPSGAVIAAPTTSLPEVVGGVRNWDYRYAWIRDASWSVVALFDLGHAAEARAFLYWATNAARLSLPRVHTMYDVYGTGRVREREVTGLRGYRDSRPVRIGNAAARQLQLDNWGHLLDAAAHYAERTGELGTELWDSLRPMAEFVAAHWHEPDQGIWEVRGRPRHFVHSKVMCWVALDRAARLVRDFGLSGPARRWEREADRVKAAVLGAGVDSSSQCLTRSFGEPAVDASLLLVPIVGFLPGDDPRIARTIDRIRSELGVGHLLRRYKADDGLPGRDGAFLACSFWLAQALALAGQHTEGMKVFDACSGEANDLGLFSEELDQKDGGFLGNFPQGLTHIAHINAALALGVGAERE